jgi:PPP family 3-phenylpropionic acid transporter
LATLLTRPALHTAGFYAVLFMANGVYLPFWPIWLEDWGLTAAEVGVYIALGMAVRVVAGMAIPAIADRYDARGLTVMICAAVTVLLFLAHLGIHTRPVLLAATLATGVTMAGLGPLAEALGVIAAVSYRFAYAQVRGIGSSGFLVANLMVGALMVHTGSSIALWWIVACMVGVALLTIGHPGARQTRTVQPPTLREIGRVMTDPTFALFMAAVGTLQASHAVFYSLGTLHWRAIGIGEAEIGALWAAGVLAEIIFMVAFGTAVVQTLGPLRSMALAGVAGLVRWGAMMFDPTGFWVWPVQSLHGVTFGLAHLGAIAFIRRAVPERYAAAAQGATGSMAAGGLMALAMLLAAAVYPALGGGTYAIGVALSGVGILTSMALMRLWRGQILAV